MAQEAGKCCTRFRKKRIQIFLVESHRPDDSVLMPDSLERWRAVSGLRQVPVQSDVTTKCVRAKWIEDEVYIQVAKTVQAMLPHSCMHLFSTAHGSWKKTIGPSDFVKWQHAGFHKHLDNPNIDDMAMLPFALS